MRNTSRSVLPIPENAFFEQTVFDQDLSQGFLELARLSLELLDLVRGRLTRRVAGEPFLARLQELLRPTVVQVLIDPFLAAQLKQCCSRHAGLPARCGSSLQRNDAGVWLCEYPGLSFQRSPVCAPQRGYDEPAILSYAISSFCPTSADGLQWPASIRPSGYHIYRR